MDKKCFKFKILLLNFHQNPKKPTRPDDNIIAQPDLSCVLHDAVGVDADVFLFLKKFVEK
tara:strand:+ start:457 stop:636 length:180 start_codon:yes stop_codon:yes gene_type:complete